MQISKVSLITNNYNKLKKPIGKICRFTKKLVHKQEAMLPLVSVPILAYVLRDEKDPLKSGYILPKEKANMNVIKDLESKNIITSQQPWQSPRFDDGLLTTSGYNDIKKQIENSNLSSHEKQQYINQLSKSNNCTFGQKENDCFPEDGINDYDFNPNSDTELTGDIPNYQSQLDEMESPVPDVDPELQTELDAIDTDISCLDDLEANLPVIGAAAAEMLPGTRFFKPIKDLLDGDVSKAAVGAGTRACEILLAPLKLGYVGMMGLCSAAYKLCGIDEDYTGFVNGVKLASKNWAEGRDAIEDEILGRETKEAKRQRLEKEIAQKRQVLEEKKARLQEEHRKKIEEKRRIETERNLEEKRRLEALKEEEYRASTWHSQRIAEYKQRKEKLHQDIENCQFGERIERKSKEKDYKIYKAKEGLSILIEKYKEMKPNANISKYIEIEQSSNFDNIISARKKLQKLLTKRKY